tara:strand:+ start:54 stop:1100 length:1047 start_codon:yes stop_codon:yes gene_type:complete
MGGDSRSVDILSASTLHPLAIKAIIASTEGVQHRANGFSEPAHLASETLEKRRKQLEEWLSGGSVWFTSSADESASWAIRGLLSTNFQRGNRIDINENSHISLKNATKRFGGEDGEVVLAGASAMDLETGRILNLEKWNYELQERFDSPKRILDARGTIGRIPVSVLCEHADAIILDSESYGGPIGIAALWVRHGIRITPLIEGSGQESGRRGGNLPIGLVNAFVDVALQLECEREDNCEKWLKIHDYLEAAITQRGGEIHGDGQERAPGITCFSMPGPTAEIYLQNLEEKGFIAAPSGGCSATAGKPSHVLTSMGIDSETALRSIRISLEPNTNINLLNELIDALFA